MKQLHILRAGKFTATDGSITAFTPDDLAEIAAGYHPATHEAPIVVGHPTTNAPAFGWIKKLTADGEGLHATLSQVDKDFAELVQAGRYKKISVSLYRPDNPANPKPGSWYPRHVGFLGGQPPAVKGLKDVQFAADDAADLTAAMDLAEVKSWTILDIAGAMRGVREWIIENSGIEKANNLLPRHLIENIENDAHRMRADDEKAKDFTDPPASPGTHPETETMTMTPAKTAAELAQLEVDLAEKAEKLTKQEQALAATAATARRQDAVAFAEQLTHAGQVLPRHTAGLAQLLSALPAEATIDFADAAAGTVTKIAPDPFLREFLDSLPVQVPMGEIGTPGGGVDFAEKSDKMVAAEARAYRSEQMKMGNKISFTAARDYVMSKSKAK